MKARNPSTGTLETVYVKALDSMPVGTIVDFDGQVSDIPTGWEQVDNVLWTNSSPNTLFNGQAVTLSDSLNNYTYYEIIYIKNNSNDRKYLSTGKVPTDQFAYMQCIYKYNSFRQITNIDNTNKQVTFSNGAYYSSYGGDNTGNDGTLCVPYQIIGYK